MVEETNFEIAGPAPLTARLVMPEAPRAVAVLNSATGVPMGYYRRFADWLAAERDIGCLTYDYRDFGASRRGPMQQSQTDLADWAVSDQQAARDWMRGKAPGLPLWVIGHSIGGATLAYQDRLDQIARVITVGSGEVLLGDHPWLYRAQVMTLWWGHGAALARAFGYLPGRYSGLGEDLPAGVFRQWRRWCTTPGFAEHDPAMHAPDLSGLSAPCRIISLSDDVTVPPVAVDRLSDRMQVAAPVERLRLMPADAGGGAVGHLRAFSRGASALWPRLVDEAAE